ncbi:transposase [Lysinibacillus sp. FSL K6-0057]|uniref:RNA-guided endonuclease InsQ/TnpB family protein n=1 Tax=Lysinibacillus sp. FSL K6-0057 TaxID=2921411 RepID=UPI00315B2C54
MLEGRVEQHHITKYHPMFKICNDYCKRSKNLYNHANYIIRQEFIKNNKFIKYNDMAKLMKVEDSFKLFGSNSGQHTLKILERNWKSFFVAIKDWSKRPDKYLGRPKLPNYLDKDKGRFVWILTNVQSKIVDGYLKFTFKPLHPYNGLIKTNVTGKHMQTRIVPKDNYYILEIVYQIEVPEETESENRILGIDLGLNNLMTIQNNFGEKPFVINGKPIKSMNAYYNAKKATMQSELKRVNDKNWSKGLARLTMKRDNKLNNYLHMASRYIVDYCVACNVEVVVIGKNDKWKQEFKRQSSFIQVPFERLIHQIQYKLRETGIRVILTEESYTSKASFIDYDEMKKDTVFKGKRVKRGLYKTNTGELINADVNGASNIIRKVFPNAFDGIEGVGFHPSIVNL